MALVFGNVCCCSFRSYSLYLIRTSSVGYLGRHLVAHPKINVLPCECGRQFWRSSFLSLDEGV